MKLKKLAARKIIVYIENGVIIGAKFIGGCSGNTQGIASLIRDMKVGDVIAKCKGIDWQREFFKTNCNRVDFCNKLRLNQEA